MTEAENLKIVGALLAALLAFAGGLLTFLNGRLKEAENAEGRNRVWFYTLGAFAPLSYIVGLAIGAINARWMLWTAFFAIVAYAIVCVLFLLLTGPVRRRELVLFSAYSVTTAIFVSSIVAMHFMWRILEIVERLPRK